MLFKVLTICLFLITCADGYYVEYGDSLPVRNNTKYTIDLYDMDWNIFNNMADESIEVRGGHHHDSDEITTQHAEEEEFDSWSIVWYIASFGGLIAFFLIVSCSEWCCRKHIRENQTQRPNLPPSAPTPTLETPPPAYDLFAPPSYDSLKSPAGNEKTEYDIYVVPVHALGSLVQNQNSREDENPPSYTSINIQENVRRTSTTT